MLDYQMGVSYYIILYFILLYNITLHYIILYTIFLEYMSVYIYIMYHILDIIL